jgi:restriction system protein
MELRQMIFAERRCRLVDACSEMGIRLDNAHDASSDAYATAALLQRYLDVLRKRDVHTIDRLKEYGQRAFVVSFVCSGFSTSTSPVIVAAQQQATDEGLIQLDCESERMNQQAADTIARFETLLVSGLKGDVRIRWDRLMTSLEFHEAVPAMPALEATEKPDLILKPDPSRKPSANDPKYTVDEGVLYSLVPWLKENKQRELEEQYRADLDTYKRRIARWNELVSQYRSEVQKAKDDYAKRMHLYRQAEREYQMRRSAFLERAAAHNAQIARERTTYQQGEASSVARAMTRVLMNSQLPTEFPDVVDIDFDQGNHLLHVIRALPPFDEMPTIKSYRVVKKDRELREQPLSDAARKRLYDGVVYQLALRTVYELFKGDIANIVHSVDLRCVIDGYDPATGHPAQLVLAQLLVDRERLNCLRLENVDPEICFKNLGGNTNNRPSSLKPIEVLLDSKG